MADIIPKGTKFDKSTFRGVKVMFGRGDLPQAQPPITTEDYAERYRKAYVKVHGVEPRMEIKNYRVHIERLDGKLAACKSSDLMLLIQRLERQSGP